MQISRPDKPSCTTTMLYEIDMLRWTAQKLSENKWNLEMDQWICLESFLVHFRNLIQFFGGPTERLQDDDLHVTRLDDFWPDASKRPDAKVLAGLVRKDLSAKYENPQKEPHTISKYLHHCTKTRLEPQVWDIGEMYDELQPTLKAFENLLLDKGRPWQNPVQGAEIPRSITGATGPGALSTVK
jgi:hypothetical protein